MQLKLSRNEQSLGMLFKKKHYQIESQLVCNEEERMAIAELDIEKLTVFEPYPFRKIDYSYKVASWADSGIKPCVETLHHAQALEEEMKDAAMKIKERVYALLDGGLEKEKSEVIDL